MKRKFLTKTARSQNQSIMYFRNAFSLVPVTQLAELVDKFTRNEVATSNEMRQVIGWKPSDDPKADQLRNSNISQSAEEIKAQAELNNPNQSSDAENNQERLKFISQFGWEVDSEPVEVNEVIIPQEFDDVYNNYNYSGGGAYVGKCQPA